MADNENTKGGGRGTGRGIIPNLSTLLIVPQFIQLQIQLQIILQPIQLKIPNFSTLLIVPQFIQLQIQLQILPQSIQLKITNFASLLIVPQFIQLQMPNFSTPQLIFHLRKEAVPLLHHNLIPNFSSLQLILPHLVQDDNDNNDTDVSDMWFGEFKRKYKWLPEHEEDMRKTFDHKASESYTNAMYRVRRGIDPGDWIPVEMRKILDNKWKEAKWKEKAEINMVNRRSSEGPLHTGGSIPTTEHYKRLKKASDISPTCWKLFQTTHKFKGDPNKWVNSKSEIVANEYEKRIVERDSQEPLGDDVSIQQADDIIFLDVVGGVDKKGRIYGLGPEAERYKRSRSSTYDGISSSEYQHMRTIISDLSAENMTLKEKLKTHEEFIHKSQEDSRLLREKLFQFMEKFSLSHLPPRSDPPPPPPPTT